MRRALRMVGALAVVVSGAVFAATIDKPEGRFRVEFPGTPYETHDSFAYPGTRTMVVHNTWTYVSVGAGSFEVSYWDAPDGTTPTLDNQTDRLVSLYEGKLTRSAPIARTGFQGREIVVDAPVDQEPGKRLAVHQLIFIVGQRIYTATHTLDTSLQITPFGQRFLDSFRLGTSAGQPHHRGG